MLTASFLKIYLLPSLALGTSPLIAQHWQYPTAEVGGQTDVYHGVVVADPYRTLEKLENPKTKQWIQEQNRLTFSYLQGLPKRSEFQKKLQRFSTYKTQSLPFQQGPFLFQWRNDGIQNQSVLYVGPTLARMRVLLDPNLLAKDGTTNISDIEVSLDAKLVAYQVSQSGSDWQSIRVRHVETGKDLPDVLQWVKFSDLAWAHDRSGFYYSRFDRPRESEDPLEAKNEFHKLYFHRIGTPQAQDILIYREMDKEKRNYYVSAEITEEGRYLVISVESNFSTNALFFKDLQNPKAPLLKMFAQYDAHYSLIKNEGEKLWLMTDLNAPRMRIVEASLAHPEKLSRDIVAEQKGKIESAVLLGDALYLTLLENVHSRLAVYSLNGTFVNDVSLPGIGMIADLGAGSKRKDSIAYYTYTSYLNPQEIHQIDTKTGKTSLVFKPTLSFDASKYISRQVWYNSKDGTSIPMMISHKKDLVLNGKNPTLLYGYGGFDISITPSFGNGPAVWMELGGVYAVANLRGGGEFGKTWYDAGRLQNKQNVFDDFIAAAEWLIAHEYTTASKLVIEGGSNGGLLVGACVNQRPELFAVAIPHVGVMDMLRFPQFTAGAAWVSDYGSPQEAKDFKTLFSYSPLHNIKPGTRYPATLVLTGDHDDRVWPGHSFKYAATLQKAQSGEAPILIRIETKAGHGAGLPRSKRIEAQADVLAFIFDNLH